MRRRQSQVVVRRADPAAPSVVDYKGDRLPWVSVIAVSLTSADAHTAIYTVVQPPVVRNEVHVVVSVDSGHAAVGVVDDSRVSIAAETHAVVHQGRTNGPAARHPTHRTLVAVWFPVSYDRQLSDHKSVTFNTNDLA